MSFKVLIIDDSQSIQKIVSACVKSLGAEVVGLGGDGEIGFELYKKTKPDLVLLDITMPNKDGRECLSDIIALEPRAKVVMLSALASPEIVKECLTVGAISFIDKNIFATKGALEAELLRFIPKMKVA